MSYTPFEEEVRQRKTYKQILGERQNFREMNIKEILKANKITQEEFAKYIGMTREGLNMKLNRECEIEKPILDSLKLLIMEKRGLKIEINLYGD
jgi:DNA-binding transcriptional regulator YiaG